MLEILHHDAVVAAAIPSLRIVGPGAEMLPQRLRRALSCRLRNGIVQHDVTMLLPEGEIDIAQNRFARLDRSDQARALRRRIEAGNRGIDARDALRRDAAGGHDQPALELFEARHGAAEKLAGLFEAEAAGMYHEVVEMAVVHRRRREAALPRRHRPRPQALELIDAEASGLGRRRQVWC